jgi:hypothetical protein
LPAQTAGVRRCGYATVGFGLSAAPRFGGSGFFIFYAVTSELYFQSPT